MTLRTYLTRVLPVLLLVFSTTANADALDDVLENGTIRFGVAEFVPWTMKSKSGDMVGFEIDVARKIAQDMGVDADIKLYDWEAIIPALQNGEIDVITGGMSITPERALKVNFSRPVAETGVGLVTNKELTSDIKRLKELNSPEIRIAVVDGTLGHSVAESLFKLAEIRVFPSAELAAGAVVKGDAHAYSTSTQQAKFLVMANEDSVDLPIAKPLIASREAIAVKKGEQELLNFLNAWVTAREADKWIATTRSYWFDTMDWEEDIAE